MGRLEKIVVLTVLFLVAVVLGVALNSDSPNSTPLSKDAGEKASEIASPGTPLNPIGVLSAGAESGVALEAEKPAAGADAPTAPGATDLAAGGPIVTVPGKDAPVPPPAAPAAYILTLAGLTPSQSPELMFYTWQAGDTLAGVAQRYYGSKDKVGRLQKANEGQSDASLKPGDAIWVPVASSTSAPASDKATTTYLVVKGDVLSGISQKFYGTSRKWQKILDANKDILSSPERLQPGMKLRIPE
jgi:nucleoid-associated protein YgaU